MTAYRPTCAFLITWDALRQRRNRALLLRVDLWHAMRDIARDVHFTGVISHG